MALTVSGTSPARTQIGVRTTHSGVPEEWILSVRREKSCGTMRYLNIYVHAMCVVEILCAVV